MVSLRAATPAPYRGAAPPTSSEAATPVPPPRAACDNAGVSEVDRGAEARVGEVLDRRYRLLRVLGSGGMGTVYEAEHVVLKRARAVKILHPSLGAARGMAQRFEREAIAAGKLRDPHCVEVSDFGKLADGTLYLAMELVKGPTLRDLLDQEGRLPLPRAARITGQMLRALEHAHSLDIVHRDVKPENIILVERDGDRDFVKLLDFGIAKLIGAEGENQEQLTATGFAVGTPRYLAPEQALAVPLDGRVDLYAATVVFYELVAGRTPFLGEGVQLVSQHLTAAPPPLSQVAPDQGVSPALDALVQRALAKSPADRFGSARELREALEACVAGGAPPPAPPPDRGRGASAAPAAGRAAAPVHTPEAFGATAMVVTPAPAQAPGAPPPPTAPLRTPRPAAAPPGAPGAEPAAAAAAPDRAAPAAGARRRRRRILLVALAVGALLIAIGVLSEVVGPGHAGRVDRAIEQLEKGETCAERLEAVRALRALGDPRAVPALRRARRRMRGGVIGIGDRNTNACLKAEAEAAIEHLERLAPR